VNTRVSPAGTCKVNALIMHFFKSVFDYSLNSALLFLPLPAAKISAVVSDNQFNISVH
jgi:hypothetical protein